MAHGIAQGILLSGKVCPGNVMVSAPSLKNLGKFKECGVRTTHCNTEVVQVSRVLFLAVKPRIIPSVLQEVSAVVTPQHIIVSVAAGVTVATLERVSGRHTGVHYPNNSTKLGTL
ncbi:pyrroline-5-carboxylate reductase 3-like [Acipenser ruthenus]|uniref:pyrroline-5-carboxylate reductase 3-like n=1 Tax=Acipenser ruthenus TaxID=7906 RepID=UPI00274097D2|nr:pyrroline-5-carboxylate reductase 3-like [Acipenser ruthenus]